MSKIKVLHFIWTANFGGIEKLVIQLSAEQNRSHEVDATIIIGCKKGEFLPHLIQLEIPHIFAGFKSGYSLNPVHVFKIRKWMINYDVIHIHTFNVMVMIAAILSRKPIIYSVHGNFNYGKVVSFGDRINNSLKQFFLNKFVDFISFNSVWTMKTATEKYNLRNKNSGVIYNGILVRNDVTDPESGNPDISEKLKNKFVIGTVARFNEQKRIDRLVQAFAIHTKTNHESILLLVGDGIRRPFLESMIENLGIKDKVIITGFQNQTRFYHEKMDLCVFPFANESFGLVVLESLSLGKPTIIFEDSGGAREILSGNFKEDIVGTVEDLVQRIAYYCSKQQSTIELAINSRKQIASKFSHEKMQNEFLDSYKKILNPKRN